MGVKQIVNYKPPTSAKHIKLRVNDREIVQFRIRLDR